MATEIEQHLAAIQAAREQVKKLAEDVAENAELLKDAKKKYEIALGDLYDLLDGGPRLFE